MAKQTINIGSAANDGTGDTLRAAGTKMNSMFSELYAASASFTTAIPFNGRKVLPRRQVTGAIAFTVDSANAFPFGSSWVSLVADGTNAPTFSGMKEWGGSAGYDNTAGVVNKIEFFYDGSDYQYAIQQFLNGPAAPRVSSTTATPGGTTILLNYSKAINTTAPDASAFALSGTGGAISVVGVSIASPIVTLTVSRALVNAETLTLSYTAPATNPISSTDATGTTLAGDLANYQFAAVGTQQFVRLSNLGTGVTETVNGLGYNYTAATPTYGNAQGSASSAVKLPSGQDGFFGFTVQAPISNTGNIAPLFGIHTSATLTTFGNYSYAIYDPGGAGTINYACPGSGVGTASGLTNVVVAAGDIVRFRRTGSTATFEVSKNGGASWTQVKQWTGAIATGDLYMHIVAGNTGYAAVQPFGSLNVA